MKKRLFGIFCIVLSLLFCMTACADHGDSQDNSGQSKTADGSSKTDAMTLADGLYITEIFSYSGAYVEDGSNDVCEDICAVRLLNSSAEHYQYLRFSIKTADGSEYRFAASTLFANATMTVLCEDKAPFSDGEIVSSTLDNCAVFQEAPTVHLETVEITYTDGFINAKNLTNDTLTNVYVYYKNTDDDGFFGGITYRASLGDIPAGELTQVDSGNIHARSSKVVFVTYDE